MLLDVKKYSFMYHVIPLYIRGYEKKMQKQFFKYHSFMYLSINYEFAIHNNSIPCSLVRYETNLIIRMLRVLELKLIDKIGGGFRDCFEIISIFLALPRTSNVVQMQLIYLCLS
jgi:hypothetical protein